MSGLYIHIPFCHSKCSYCDFFSTPRGYDTGAYTKALLTELAVRREEIRDSFSTIYIGGGTPSSLPLHTLSHLINSLPIDEAEEITIEVNPEDVTPEFINWLTGSGINRVSMGIQSFSDRELKAVGRRHSSSQARNALESLLASGMNVSADLIYGLPFQTPASWESSLSLLLSYRPHHLSCYLLSYEPGTSLTARLQHGKIKECGEDELCDMYDILCLATSHNGYEHYEIANFALPGYRSKHNSSYWTFTPYLGLGPGAHSFDGKLRRINPPKITDYIAAEGKHFFETEEETPSEQLNDMIMVGLRTSDGLSMMRIRDTFGGKASEQILSKAMQLVKENRLEVIGTEQFRIPEKKWLTADSVIVDLMVFSRDDTVLP